MNSQIGTSKRKLFDAIAGKLDEAKIKYDQVLEVQKQAAKAKEEEFKKLKEQLQPSAATEAAGGGGGKKKNKKKK